MRLVQGISSVDWCRGLTRGGVTVIEAVEVVVLVINGPVVACVVWRVVWDEDQAVPAGIPAQTTACLRWWVQWCDLISE